MHMGLVTLLSATAISGKNAVAKESEKKHVSGDRSLIQDRPHVPTVLDIPHPALRSPSQLEDNIEKYLVESEKDIASNPYLLSGHPLPIELPALELLLKNKEISNGESPK